MQAPIKITHTHIQRERERERESSFRPWGKKTKRRGTEREKGGEREEERRQGERGERGRKREARREERAKWASAGSRARASFIQKGKLLTGKAHLSQLKVL